MKKIKDILNKFSGLSIHPSIMVLMIAIVFYSCDSDNINDDSYFTLTEDTVASFCENNEGFSVFYQLIQETNNYSLLSTYGNYTAFIPTDEAFNTYFNENNISYEQLTAEEKLTIVRNHIIRGEKSYYETLDFTTGALAKPNMNDRYLTISFALENGVQVIYVNTYSPIIDGDNEVHNGIVHTIGRLIQPSDDYLDGILRSRDEFKLFSQALELTKMNDSIQFLYDEDYVNPWGTEYLGDLKIPEGKKYGYTLFAEPDNVFKKAGIETIEQLISFATRYYGSEDAGNYESRNNALNRFVSYHILDRQMSTSSFLYNGTATAVSAQDSRFEYYETMFKYRMIEIKSGNKINTLQNGTYVGLDEGLSNITGVNGFIHGLTDILVYDENVMINDVLNKRIRFDFYAIPPQLTNNNIRWQTGEVSYTIPYDYCGEYFTFNEASAITMWANDWWTNYQSDEILVKGWYDFTLRMLPMPPGTYEIRLGYRAETWRGVAQLFIDGQISGIPVDLKIKGDDPRVGRVDDSETTDNGYENDKMMRNLGYMKAPASIYTLQENGRTLRSDPMALRIIIGTYTFQDYDYHYFRAKNVQDEEREFHADYIEYVPASYIDNEDRN